MQLRVHVKKMFLDDRKILRLMDNKTRKVLNRYGASVRKAAQHSMRSKKGAAPPGKPPHAHGQKLLRKNIFYYYDKDRKVVVIGPVLFERTSDQKVPSTLEFGGSNIQQTKQGPITRQYSEHPYMRPAEAKYRGQVASWYRS